jgi:UDP-GlcNAc:undecaprenyl-phosphate GlcNAc-1-phosphate transferase
VLILWAWTAILSAFLLFPLFMHRANAFIAPGAAALGVGLYTLFHPGLRKGNGEAADDVMDEVTDESLDDSSGYRSENGRAPQPAAAGRSADVIRLP